MPEGLREEHNQQQRRYYERWLKPRMLPKDSPYIRRQVDELLKFGGVRPGERALELGCGMGRYTLRLAELGIKVEGLDISPVMLEELRKFDGGRYGIPVHCADIVQHPTELTGQFDVVLGFFTLHHLHDLPLCFEAMTRLLKPGGKVVFLEPNPYNVLFYIQILVAPGMTWQGDRGLVQMRQGVIYDAMSRAGLKNSAMARFGFFPPVLYNRSWGARLEALLERPPLWRTFLPFQLFRAEMPRA
jgi:SAM-dependent methyltransferase